MERYLLKKGDKTVTISLVGVAWNYKKEFGTNIIENFNIDFNKLSELLMEQYHAGYEIIKPTVLMFHKPESILSVEEFNRRNGDG